MAWAALASLFISYVIVLLGVLTWVIFTWWFTCLSKNNLWNKHICTSSQNKGEVQQAYMKVPYFYKTLCAVFWKSSIITVSEITWWMFACSPLDRQSRSEFHLWFQNILNKMFLIVGRMKTILYSRGQSLSKVEFVRSHKVHVCLTIGHLRMQVTVLAVVAGCIVGDWELSSKSLQRMTLLMPLWCWWITLIPLKSFSLSQQCCKWKWSFSSWRRWQMEIWRLGLWKLCRSKKKNAVSGQILKAGRRLSILEVNQEWLHWN